MFEIFHLFIFVKKMLGLAAGCLKNNVSINFLHIADFTVQNVKY